MEIALKFEEKIRVRKEVQQTLNVGEHFQIIHLKTDLLNLDNSLIYMGMNNNDIEQYLFLQKNGFSCLFSLTSFFIYVNKY